MPDWQTPEAQASLNVQALPSEQEPLTAGKAQAPVDAVQLLAVQTLASSQMTALPTQVPVLVQASPVVQAVPSVQVAPVLAALTHLPVVWLQLSKVQALPSSHLMAVPVHSPLASQISAVVHKLPSSQTFPTTALFWH